MSVNNVNVKVPTWIKYFVADIVEISAGIFKLKGQFAKDNLKDFHGWCVKNGSFESRYFKNDNGVFITLEKDTIKMLEKAGLKHTFS